MTSDLCVHLIHPGSRYVDPEPPEYCDEPTVDGTEYCEKHLDES